MELSLAQKQIKKEERKRECAGFFSLVHMLLSDRMKLSFKSKPKDSILRLVLSVVLFAALTAICYGIYFVFGTFHIFSLLGYTPLEVPSIITNIVLALTFLGAIFGLVKMLYLSPDNRLMITYPLQNRTIFAARMSVYFISEYVRVLTTVGPILLAFLLGQGFPWYMCLWLFLALLIFTIAITLAAAALSIPGYFVVIFLKKNSLVASVFYILIFAGFIGVVSWFMSLIPNEIDIFTNWGPYFTKLQSGLHWYRSNMAAFYDLTAFLTGDFDGFHVTPFPLSSLYVLLTLLGTIAVFGFLAYSVVNSMYLRLASQSFEFENDKAFSRHHNRPRKWFFAQMAKETVLVAKNPSSLMSTFGIFVFLPILIALMNKIFGAMSTNTRGNLLISCANVLIIMLVSLNTNSGVATAYSEEGRAFSLDRVYPRHQGAILTSKLVIPALIGAVSIIVSCLAYGDINVGKTDIYGNVWTEFAYIPLLAIGLIAFYFGHMLFAAGLDFTASGRNFAAKTGESKNERIVFATSFVLSVFEVLIFYMMLQDSSSRFAAYLKLMLIGIGFLALNVVLYLKKIKYVYKEGD
ncbi:MAG: hypothetical protein LKG11_04815 [Bacilli bacterium]|jgi:hypothetical protein|nr:hypothetical protein [Bacilli bacterium]